MYIRYRNEAQKVFLKQVDVGRRGGDVHAMHKFGRYTAYCAILYAVLIF